MSYRISPEYENIVLALYALKGEPNHEETIALLRAMHCVIEGSRWARYEDVAAHLFDALQACEHAMPRD